MKHEPVLTRRAFLGMKESDQDFYTRKHDEACACNNHELANYYSAQLEHSRGQYLRSMNHDPYTT